MNEKTPEQIEQEQQERNLRMLRDLSNSEAFQIWIDEVVNPTIQILEAELASEKADEMSEPVLRGKLKQLNSLKYIFKDVFEIAKQNLKITK